MVPYLCGANWPKIFALRSLEPLNLFPAEFWTPQSVIRGVLELWNMCPANSQKYILRGQNKQINLTQYFFFPLNHFLRKKYFGGRYLYLSPNFTCQCWEADNIENKNKWFNQLRVVSLGPICSFKVPNHIYFISHQCLWWSGR